MCQVPRSLPETHSRTESVPCPPQRGSYRLPAETHLKTRVVMYGGLPVDVCLCESKSPPGDRQVNQQLLFSVNHELSTEEERLDSAGSLQRLPGRNDKGRV